MDYKSYKRQINLSKILNQPLDDHFIKIKKYIQDELGDFESLTSINSGGLKRFYFKGTHVFSINENEDMMLFGNKIIYQLEELSIDHSFLSGMIKDHLNIDSDKKINYSIVYEP